MRRYLLYSFTKTFPSRALSTTRAEPSLSPLVSIATTADTAVSLYRHLSYHPFSLLSTPKPKPKPKLKPKPKPKPKPYNSSSSSSRIALALAWACALALALVLSPYPHL